MKVYVLVNEDSHYDTEVTVFTTVEAAVQEARRVAEEGARGYGYDEEEIPGWIFYARYSPETGSVRVVEKEIQ